MKAPFPYFGGKSKIAETVWARFGSPRQYIEPFCESAAVPWRFPRCWTTSFFPHPHG